MQRFAANLPCLFLALALLIFGWINEAVLVLLACLLARVGSRLFLPQTLTPEPVETAAPTATKRLDSCGLQELPLAALRCRLDDGMSVAAANPAAARLFGYAPEQMAGLPLSALLGDEAAVARCTARLRRGEQVSEQRLQVELQGERCRLLLFAAREADELPNTALCLLYDASAQLRGEEEQRRYARIYHASEDYLALVDRESCIESVNQHCVEQLRLPRKALIGKSVEWMVGRRAFVEAVQPAIRRCLAGVQVELLRWFKVPQLGGRRYLRVRFAPYRDENGEAVGVVISVSDLTDMEREREQLRHSAMRYANLFDGLSDCTAYSRNPDRGDGWVSRAVEGQFGYSAEQFTERLRTALAALPGGDPASSPDVTPPYWVSLRDGYGKLRELELREAAQWDEKGDLIELHGIAIDVTRQRRTLARLRANEARYRAVFELENDVVLLLDAENYRILDANPAAERVYGYSRERLLRMDVLQLSVEPDECRQFFLMAGDHGHSKLLREHRRKDGSAFPIEVSLQRFALERQDAICVVIRDIGPQQRAETALRDSRERFRAIVEASPLPVLIVRMADGVIVYANAPAAQVVSLSPGTLSGRRLSEFYPRDSRRRALLSRLCRARRLSDEEIEMPGVEGGSHWFALNASLLNFLGEPAVAIGLLNVTESHRLTRQLSHQATHDSLTGLVNRAEFELRLARAINSASQRGAEHTLCYIDLDQFKFINDSGGHSVGDLLLRQLAALLAGEMRSRDTLARLGGDEFGVLVEHCDRRRAGLIADKLRTQIERFRFVHDEKTFRISASIGVVQIRANGGDVSDLLKAADSACYVAKEAGRNRVHVYHDDDATMLRRRSEIEWVARVRDALAEDRLMLYRQPIIGLGDKRGGSHCELLLRLRDTDGTLVPPGAFMPAAERYNLAAQVDLWVVDRVLALLREGVLRDDVCSFNLSGQSLGDIEACERIARRLAAPWVPVSRLCIEVTETAAISNLAAARDFIERVKKLGCRIALDDFGSGLSSYAYLKNLPVDYLKIDGMFVRGIAEDAVDFAMVRSINEIGHELGKQTIAECVGSELEVAMLEDIGVDYAQGYALGEPAPLPQPETSR